MSQKIVNIFLEKSDKRIYQYLTFDIFTSFYRQFVILSLKNISTLQ